MVVRYPPRANTLRVFYSRDDCFGRFAILCADSRARQYEDAVVLASAGVAVFLGYVGVFGSELRSSEEVSEAKSRSFPFPSRECHVLQPRPSDVLCDG